MRQTSNLLRLFPWTAVPVVLVLLAGCAGSPTPPRHFPEPATPDVVASSPQPTAAFGLPGSPDATVSKTERNLPLNVPAAPAPSQAKSNPPAHIPATLHLPPPQEAVATATPTTGLPASTQRRPFEGDTPSPTGLPAVAKPTTILTPTPDDAVAEAAIPARSKVVTVIPPGTVTAAPPTPVPTPETIDKPQLAIPEAGPIPVPTADPTPIKSSKALPGLPAADSGAKAKGFTLPSATGGTVSLDSYLGDKNVVLVFYRAFW